ncbi:GNAT family N-acetyltransferase [Paenibacillus sp. FSL R5-0527]|uniref:GNAT family N-acetyltransferase n=1 Tax=Paenibacillus sp. FSL R5-0527 TaxID=2975321 RepID=UPI0030FBBE20
MEEALNKKGRFMMNNLALIEPAKAYQSQYIEMIEEWKETGEKLVPFVLRFEYEDFDSFLERLIILRDGPVEDGKTVNSSTFWLVEDHQRVVGAANIRHGLNDSLLNIGGHIGYGIRPSARKKGYATEILRQALIHAKSLGISRALVTCAKDNIGSAKAIQKNNGILAFEAVVGGVEIQRYWISLT